MQIYDRIEYKFEEKVSTPKFTSTELRCCIFLPHSVLINAQCAKIAFNQLCRFLGVATFIRIQLPSTVVHEVISVETRKKREICYQLRAKQRYDNLLSWMMNHEPSHHQREAEHKLIFNESARGNWFSHTSQWPMNSCETIELKFSLHHINNYAKWCKRYLMLAQKPPHHINLANTRNGIRKYCIIILQWHLQRKSGSKLSPIVADVIAGEENNTIV